MNEQTDNSSTEKSISSDGEKGRGDAVVASLAGERGAKTAKREEVGLSGQDRAAIAVAINSMERLTEVVERFDRHTSRFAGWMLAVAVLMTLAVVMQVLFLAGILAF